MKRLYVFADFDWLKEPRMIGELSMNHFVARTVMDSAIVLTGLGAMAVYFSVMT